MTKFKVLSLISGGIDSPVATYFILKKGLEAVCVHFNNEPFADEKSTNKTKELVKILSKMFKKKIKLYIVPHGNNQTEFLRNCEPKAICVLCRRMMFRISEKIAENENALALVTGENLGQVASQTLDNLAVERQAVKIPILQPLLGFDKEETVALAKKIKTYEPSILPGSCCSLAPKYPITSADLEMIKAEEAKLDIKEMVMDSIKSINYNFFDF